MSDLRSKLTVIIERRLDIIIKNDGRTATPVINNASETLDEIIALVREHDKHDHASFALDIAEKTRQRCIEAIDDTTYSREIKDGMIKALEKQE